MEQGKTNIVKIIDNEMSPRFGHTITLGKKIIKNSSKNKSCSFWWCNRS
jgi:hypothetical protein